MGDSNKQLLAAVNALYSHPDQEVKKQANNWLEHWQQTVDAWGASDAVLHDHSCPADAQVFCAQTLRTKVRSCFLSPLQNCMWRPTLESIYGPEQRNCGTLLALAVSAAATCMTA